ncbi:phosphoribosyl-ATP diphosphatase [Candidatus Vidania fulgoroideorum]
MIVKLFKIIKKKIKRKEKKSYSYHLFNNIKILKRKIIEESIEYILEFKKGNKKKIFSEFCDLLYHIIVPLVKYKVNIKKIKY